MMESSQVKKVSVQVLSPVPSHPVSLPPRKPVSPVTCASFWSESALSLDVPKAIKGIASSFPPLFKKWEHITYVVLHVAFFLLRSPPLYGGGMV